MSEEEKKAIENLKTDIRYSDLLTAYNDDIDILINLIEKQEKVIDAIKNKLEKHIKFCEQEARGHLDNKMCYISLGFDKSLLEIINRKVENNE